MTAQMLHMYNEATSPGAMCVDNHVNGHLYINFTCDSTATKRQSIHYTDCITRHTTVASPQEEDKTY